MVVRGLFIDIFCVLIVGLLFLGILLMLFLERFKGQLQ